MASIKARLEDGPLDWNGLSYQERGAAFALIDQGRDKRALSVEGRTVLVKRKPNWLIQFLTMGARN